jgi:hypothetical protein
MSDPLPHGTHRDGSQLPTSIMRPTRQRQRRPRLLDTEIFIIMMGPIRFNSVSLSVACFLVLVGKGALAVRNLRIAAPLQALTIWDTDFKEAPIKTHRGRFLSRFKAGLEAESAARKSIAEGRNQRLRADATSNDWAAKAASADGRVRRNEARYVEQAYDEALRKLERAESQEKQANKKEDFNRFQFVGVVNSASAGAKNPIQWYARKKPELSNWSVRLIHVNRDAVIKDLFSRGKVDIFARYDNTGERDKETNQPIVASRYSVRERTWK